MGESPIKLNSRCNHGTNRSRGLETESDREPVKIAVDGKAACPDGTTAPQMLGMGALTSVRRHRPVEDHVADKADRDCRKRRSDAVRSGRQRNGLRDQIEQRDADHRPGAEPQDQVEPILQAQGQQPTQQGHEKGRNTQSNSHRLASIRAERTMTNFR